MGAESMTQSDVREARAVTDELTVHSEVRGNTAVLRFDGDIDLLTAPVANQSIKNALQQAPRALVVDLSGVRFLASAGMAELVIGHRLAGTAATRSSSVIASLGLSRDQQTGGDLV